MITDSNPDPDLAAQLDAIDKQLQQICDRAARAGQTIVTPPATGENPDDAPTTDEPWARLQRDVSQLHARVAVIHQDIGALAAVAQYQLRVLAALAAEETD